jgi:hypothetical protein
MKLLKNQPLSPCCSSNNKHHAHAIAIAVALTSKHRQASHIIARYVIDAKLINALACVCCALDGRSKFFCVS